MDKSIISLSRSGFTLVEVLISFLLISIVLFCFDSAEIFSMRTIRAAYYFSVATNQIHGMTERLHTLSHHKGFNEQMESWNKENQEVLPQGRGEVKGNYPTYQIIIYWGKKQKECRYIKLGREGCLSEEVTL